MPNIPEIWRATVTRHVLETTMSPWNFDYREKPTRTDKAMPWCLFIAAVIVSLVVKIWGK